MARNALQLSGDDSGNALAQAPYTLGDMSDPAVAASAQVGGPGAVDALGQWLAEQRAKSSQMGAWNDQTGLPTQSGWLDAARAYAYGLGTKDIPEAPAPGAGFTAYHGSPHDFSAFDLSKIGTGEGAQAYGHGMYLADSEGVARSYRDALAPTRDVAQLLVKHGGDADAALTDLMNNGGATAAEHDALLQYRKTGVMPSTGHMYEVQVAADPARFLDWDKPLSEQHPNVQEALKPFGLDPKTPGPRILTAIHHTQFDENGRLIGELSRPEDLLQQAGIPGIRYLDRSSRGVPVANARTTQAIADRQSQIAELQADLARNQDNPNLLPPYFTARQQQIAGHQQVIDQLQQQMNENKPTSNTVVFSPEIMAIIRKYGIAGLMAGGGAAGMTQQQNQPNPLIQ